MQNWTNISADRLRIDFLLFDQFSNLALANLLEPLRAANTLLRKTAYQWRILTPDNQVVHSSSGLPIMPTAKREDMHGDVLHVVSSYGYLDHASVKTSAILRAMSKRYSILSGVDTGAWLLGMAGVLEGRKATIHRDLLDRFAERFPQIEVGQARFVEDGDRLTCAGGMAAFDFTCQLIKASHGAALVLELTQLFGSEGVAVTHRIGGEHGRDRRVERCLQQMSTHIEQPLTIAEIAQREGWGQREMAKRFNLHFGASPGVVYRRLRLNTARQMLSDTRLNIGEIAMRCGYEDPSAFSRAFRREFGLSAREAIGAG